jgi:hypothetical protein
MTTPMLRYYRIDVHPSASAHSITASSDHDGTYLRARVTAPTRRTRDVGQPDIAHLAAGLMFVGAFALLDEIAKNG